MAMTTSTPKERDPRMAKITSISPLVSSSTDLRNEKNALVNLNNRLAVYVDKVRSLENQNQHLKLKVETSEETSFHKVENVKAIYESELSDTKQLLQESANQNAALTITVDGLQNAVDESNFRATEAELNLRALKTELSAAKEKLQEKTTLLEDVIQEKNQNSKQLKTLRGDCKILEKEKGQCIRLLEEGSLKRVELENEIAALKNQINLNQKLHHQEINESRKQQHLVMKEVSEQRTVYDVKLEENLEDLRMQQEDDIEEYKNKLEIIYKDKLNLLQRNLDCCKADKIYLDEKLRSTVTNFTKLESKYDEAKSLLSDVDTKLKEAEDRKRIAVRSAKAERDAIKMQLEEVERERLELSNINMQLDMEIKTYRNLLEEEETRLNISPSSAGDSTKLRSRVGRKRKRVMTVEKIQKSAEVSPRRRNEQSDLFHEQPTDDGNCGIM